MRRPKPVGGEDLGRLLRGVIEHSARHCDDNPTCPTHNPTEHHMRRWPQFHGSRSSLTLRECPHGRLHPDPDDVRWGNARQEHIDTECDGCCDPARAPSAI